MNKANIHVTEQAGQYLAEMAARENCRELRIGVQYPGTPISQCYLSFSHEQSADDEVMDFDGFRLRYKRTLSCFIDGLSVDYRKNRLGNEVRLKAPNLHNLQEPPADADLELRANWVLNRHVNPSLAEHQGSVIVDRVEEQKVWLKFGGNCLGCGNAEKTLVEFVEKVLREYLPEVDTISEVTMH